ncbi:substrate-binding periplasmic protein [Salidesulfovibrio onnuriiensis]|uniref:substrate-binding periplasmic protein n=1 Tax=Salidesulfovibrio onnuriiensis TaxID=2583823 RepID=UPI0011C880DC|nr:transporter substrate-binding domain-containing protein [Salidesulfovibrio onnuriiensis]
MKIIGILCFFLVFLCSAPAGARAESITLSADEWCPYNCGVTDPLKGYVLDIAREIYGKEGIDLRYVTTSWEDALHKTRAGVYEGAIGVAKSEAPDFVFPDQEVGRSGNVFFTTVESSWTFTGFDSLAGRRLGVSRDYFYGETMMQYLEKAVEGVDVIYALGAQPLRENLERLVDGQIDMILSDANVLLFTARDMGLAGKIRSAGSVGEPDPVYVAFSPNLPRARVYARMLDDGMAKLRSTGKLREILQQYGLEDWRESPLR